MKRIDEILCEMRKDIPRVVDAKVILRNYTDRIEAQQAAEDALYKLADYEESSQVGDMAAMLEALQTISKCDISKEEDCYTLYRVCEEALSKPPRNCDVYETEAERQSAFINWYNETFDLKGSKYAIDTCDLKHNIDNILHEYITWLFAKAEGEAK